MINQEKVALMTKLASYEEKEGKKNIPLSKYYREDYVGLKMVNTGIIVTLAYILVLAILVFVNIDKMMTELANMDYIQLGTNVLIGYVIVLVAYMVISYVVYSVKFRRVRDSLNEYNGNLKKLYNIYKDEEFSEKRGIENV
ncbi:MAG: hypothetical protein IJP13_05770 [Lachnospiraceae bacterium]|nr:hypothetical protein [Lachnospiraceae bacterium]